MATTSAPQDITEWTPDIQFVVGMVCIGIGAVLLIIAILWIIFFIIRTKKDDSYVRRKIQAYERKRHLENYYKTTDEDEESIVIGANGHDLGKPNGVVNSSNNVNNNSKQEVTVNGNGNIDMNGSAHAEGLGAEALSY